MNRHASLSTLILSLAVVAATCASVNAIEVGEYVLESQSVIREWQHNYTYLGNPIENEHSVVSPTGTKGTRVRCMTGIICMRYGSNAKAYHARGEIARKFLNLGGPQGQLGFPLGNQFATDANGHFAQRFERGTIYWSQTTNNVSVGPPTPPHGATIYPGQIVPKAQVKLKGQQSR